MFFNELQMLRLRLRVHSPVVDFFVIRSRRVAVDVMSLYRGEIIMMAIMHS